MGLITSTPVERETEDEGEGVPVDVDPPTTVCCGGGRKQATGYSVVPNMKHLAEQDCCGCCPPCLGSPVGLCFVALQLVLLLLLLLVAFSAAARCAARHGHGDAEAAWAAAAAAMGNRSAWTLAQARAAAPVEVARLATHATNSTLAFLAGHAPLADRLCDRGGDWLGNGSRTANGLAWLRALPGTNGTLPARAAALWERAPGQT